MGQIYQINQVKVPYGATGEQLKKAAAKQAGLDGSVFSSFRIVKESLDARKKPQIFRVCNVQVTLTSEKKAAAALKKGELLKVQEKPYTLPAAGTETLKHRPVIIGSGPAGLFCGLLLAKAGYAPLLLERGASAPGAEGTAGAVLGRWHIGCGGPMPSSEKAAPGRFLTES